MIVTEKHRQTRTRKESVRPEDGAPASTLLPISPDYPVRTKDKVAIVGFADGHRHLAPFNDPDFEIWGLNRLHSVLPGRYDRWFEIHDIGMYLGQPFGDDSGHHEAGQADTQHLEFLRTFPGPIYLRAQDIGRIHCPSARPYALVPVLRDFGNYMTNSISWMIAYAIAMQFREIHLYGVDMAQDQLFSAEYRQQRPSCEFLLGIAVGRGIKIHRPAGSDLLLADHLYGFEDGSPILLKRLARMQELGKRKDEVRQKLAQLEVQKQAMEADYWRARLELTAAINQSDGAQQQIQYEMINLTVPPEVQPPTTLG